MPVTDSPFYFIAFTDRQLKQKNSQKLIKTPTAILFNFLFVYENVCYTKWDLFLHNNTSKKAAKWKEKER